MPKWTRALVLIAPMAFVAAPAAAQDTPEGVTKEMIDEGGKLYRGDGICYACHGQDGKGMQGLGANLTDDEWLHSDGSVDGILKTIINGVSGDKSSVGVSMPPKGGSALSEDKLRAVAAYVWSLRQADQ
jgi:cbb3-type cytochrome c oxidase subunit III